MFKKLKNKKGFTLIELVVVIAILAILAVIAVPRLLGFQDRAREQADKQTAVQVRNAVALLHANGELYPEAGGTTFTIDADGDLAYATGDSFHTVIIADQVASGAGATTIAAADAQALIEELTDEIALVSTNKIIQIAVGEDGEVQQSLVPAPTPTP